MNKYQTAVKQAKELGLTIEKGMKTEAIEAMIADKQGAEIVVVVGNTEGEVEAALEGETAAPEAPVQEEKVERRGRPVVPGCARQQRLASYEAKKAEGHELKQGRPVNGESERQKRLAAMEAKRIANGGVLKRGRPAQPKPEPVAEAPKGEETEVVKEEANA